MGLAARFRGIKVQHFNAETRNDPAFAEFAKRLTVTAPPEIDGLYPKLRPARVTVTTAKGKFVRQADEALGSRIVPLDDAGLDGEVHRAGRARARAARAPHRWQEQLWDIETRRRHQVAGRSDGAKLDCRHGRHRHVEDVARNQDTSGTGTIDIKTIGFIGIGNMGRPMAANLVKGGYQVVAYDADGKRAAQFARDAGAKSAATLAELGARGGRDRHHAADRQGGARLPARDRRRRACRRTCRRARWSST